jgi:PPK2 family polyphosphate:nucleotide phosphotransferase
MKKLEEIPTTPSEDISKKETEEKIVKLQQKFQDLQELLWIKKKSGLLVVLQGMDASGKDGVIKVCLNSIDPMGFKVKGFKVPTEEEAAHDFLWRIHQHTPERGMIQFFNRSHYEDVLYPTVHKLIDQKEAQKRFEHINDFEDLLKSNDTIILKFYLHISHEKQKERFEERRTNPLKNWKYNAGDLKESTFWNDYMKAYENIFESCSEVFPWHIIPADKKWYKNFLILEKIVSTLEGLKMKL